MNEKPVSILVIDDDWEDYLILEGHIMDSYSLDDCSLQYAATLEEAAQALNEKEYDLLFLDYWLGTKTGVEVLEDLRGIGVEAPVILLSGQGSEEIAVQAMRAGALDYINKNSLTPARVESAVERALVMVERERLRERAEEEVRKLTQAVEQSPTVVVITDRDGFIEYVNPKFSSVTGYKPHEVIGKKPNILNTHTMGSEVYEELWETIVSGREWRGEFYNKRKDGEHYWETATISPIKDVTGTITHFVKVAEDSTQTKEDEEKLNYYTMELELKNLELEAAHKKINDNIQKARQIHQRFLPASFPSVSEHSFSAYYRPAEQIGGDFYNVIRVGDQLILYVSDVTGHGLDGAMLTIFLRNTINMYLLAREKDETVSPSAILKFLAERYITEDFAHDYFICMLLGVYDTRTCTLTYCNAGVQIPPIVIADGEVTISSLGGIPISSAVDKELMCYEEETQILEPGTTIMFTTDGLVEEEKAGGEIYGEERLRVFLKEHAFLPPEFITRSLCESLQDFTGDHGLRDDITFLMMQRHEEIEEEQTFSLPSSFACMEEAEDKVQTFLERYLEDTSLPYMGFHELLANAIEHGNAFAEDKKVFVSLKATRRYLHITVEDQGDGFNWQKNIDRPLDIMDYGERSRGIIMTCLALNMVGYNQRGNAVSFLVYRE